MKQIPTEPRPPQAPAPVPTPPMVSSETAKPKGNEVKMDDGPETMYGGLL